MNDDDLLQLCRNGNEEAFLTLYQRHQGAVFRFALHMTGKREIAEEITQEVFLAMLSETRQYISGQGSLQAYLIGMARNQARRQMRHFHALTSAFEEAGWELRDNAGEQFVNELSRTQDLHALRAAILTLPPNYREIVILCDLEGMDYANAAAQLGCAVGTVRSRLHRARAILKAKLQKRECPA